jgi:hypothetical protein
MGLIAALLPVQSSRVLVEDFELPEGPDAEQLIHGLARLIELRGAEPFLSAPLLLADPRYFPETIAPRAEGVATVLRRLLAYAGLSPTRIDVEIYDERRSHLIVDDQDPHSHAGAAAWFMDIDDGVYRFGVRESELRDEHSLMGTLGHEVAHAYRSEHGLVVPTSAIEEQLTDLTTVYLGFGAFTLESSFQFKTGGYDARGERLLYETHRRGYLRPGQLAFLLGLQLAIRGQQREPLAPVLKSLSDNQRAALERAVAQLSPEREDLSHQLGLPPVESWPAPHELDDALVPLPDTEVTIHDAPQLQREEPPPERIAFRLAGNRAMWGTALGIMGGFTAGLMLHLDWGFWPLTLGLGGLGYVLGKRRLSPNCTGCGKNVPVAAPICQNCSATLVSDIGELADVFTAEEAYAQSRRSGPASLPSVACPQCSYEPSAADTWECDCGYQWNTFTTKARCPACEKTHRATACPSCESASDHDAWYHVS